MSIQIIPEARQGHGAFNGGEIVENKPIGFPQDRSETRPYSNLFYWAHARATTDSTIGLHPHQGFEICSFVLKGQIRHYDTKLKEWRSLEAGDVQIIRSGNGISHSEFMAEGSEMFQIWFDPDLQKTLEKPASYDDYKAAEFPVSEPEAGIQIKTLAGEGSPFTKDTPELEILRISLEGGKKYGLQLDPGQIASAYLIEGKARVNDQPVTEKDFMIAKEANTSLNITAEADSDLFVILSPAETSYPTYIQLRKAGMN